MVTPVFPEDAAKEMPDTGESTKIPVAGPVGMVLVGVADDADDEDAPVFSLPLSQAVRPTINRVDNKRIHEFFLNGCVDFIKEVLFLIN